MRMNARAREYPQNLLQYLRKLNPKATIIDFYEKDEELLDEMIDAVTNIEEALIFYDFWEEKYTFKYFIRKYGITFAETRYTLQNIARRLITLEPKKNTRYISRLFKE